MGPFYAYLTDDLDDSYFRYLVVFADRETADDWWRMISNPFSPFTASIQRFSPQFYTQITGQINVTRFFSNPGLPEAKRFLGKMFWMLLQNSDGKLPFVIPPITITDHISGKWYFIRSKADPWSHWYLRVKGECLVCGDVNCNSIHVSSEHRTKFCVRVRNPADEDSQISKEFIMIGRDQMSIAAPKGYILHVNSDVVDLKAIIGYQGETDLIFDDLKDRFITRAEKRASGEVWEYVELVEKGLGEAWELAD